MDDPAFATLVGMLYYAMGFEHESSGRSIALGNISNSKIWEKIKNIIKDFK